MNYSKQRRRSYIRNNSCEFKRLKCSKVEFLDPADFQNIEKVFNNFNNLNLPLLMFQSKRKESSTFKSRETFYKMKKKRQNKIISVFLFGFRGGGGRWEYKNT